MHTTQQVADYINQTKPDLKQFWEEATPDPKATISKLLTEQFSFLQLFKLELLVSYCTSYPRITFSKYSSIGEAYTSYLYKLSVLIPYAKDTIYSYSIFKAPITDSNLIAPLVDNYAQYLNPYLKSKCRPKSSTVVKLKLDDNLMSLAIFKKWLEDKKTINSIQAKEFILSVASFKQHTTEFIEAILDHCPKPSIKLQEFLLSYSIKYLLADTKYIAIYRGDIKYSHNHLGLTTVSLMDSLDSQYKPFIAGLPRVPTTAHNEVSSLLATAAKLINSSTTLEQSYAKAIIEHLKDPAYSSVLPNHITELQKSIEAFSKVIKELSNGSI